MRQTICFYLAFFSLISYEAGNRSRRKLKQKAALVQQIRHLACRNCRQFKLFTYMILTWVGDGDRPGWSGGVGWGGWLRFRPVECAICITQCNGCCWSTTMMKPNNDRLLCNISHIGLSIYCNGKPFPFHSTSVEGLFTAKLSTLTQSHFPCLLRLHIPLRPGPDYSATGHGFAVCMHWRWPRISSSQCPCRCRRPSWECTLVPV